MNTISKKKGAEGVNVIKMLSAAHAVAILIYHNLHYNKIL